MLKRYPDWPQRLAEALRQRARSRYAWGQNDCAMFAADAVQAMTGQDFAAMFRGRYRTKRGASQVLRAHGWSGLEEMVDSILPRHDDQARLRRGDVVLYAGRYGDFLGIYWAGAIVGPGAERMAQHPADDSIKAAWRVG